MLIAIEGIDQAGKATQAELLFRHIQSLYQPTTLVSFPDYKTTIGGMIRQALEDDFDWRPKPLQLLCAANRFERQAEIEKWLAAGIIVVCDRYIASGIAYGAALGVETEWLTRIHQPLPQPDWTILLDISPRAAARRKTSRRDAYERNLELLAAVRTSYLAQAAEQNWTVLDAHASIVKTAAKIRSELANRLAPVVA